MGIKWPRAVRRKGADLGEFYKRRWAHGAVRATRDRDVEIACAQALDGVFHGCKCRSARGVDHEVWSLKVKCLGDAARDHIGELARHRVFVDLRHLGFELFAYLSEELGTCPIELAPEHVLDFGVMNSQVRSVAKVSTERIPQDYSAALASEFFVQVAGIIKGLANSTQADELGGVGLFNHRRRHAIKFAVEFKTMNPSTDL